LLRLLSRPFATIFLSNLFIVFVKLFEALLLELLALPNGFDVCLKGETLLLLAFLNLDDYVSESYTEDRFVIGFL